MSAAPSPHSPPGLVRRVVCGAHRAVGIGERGAPPVSLAHRTSIGGAGPGAGGPCGVRLTIAHVPGWVIGAEGSTRTAAGLRRALGPALGDKEPAWGRGRGEAAALALHPLHLPRPAREEEQFVYLGLQESCPPPGSRRPPSPSSLPSLSAQSCPVPPAAPSSSPSSSSSSSPPSPSLLGRVRGGGSGKRFVRLAAQLSPGGRRLGGARRPAALPPPRRPRARRRGGLGFEEERVSQSQAGRFSLYKQEAENHWHTVAFLIVPGGGAGPAS